MQHTEGKIRWLGRLAYGIPWVLVVLVFGYILWLNIPLISLSTRTCKGTDCSFGVLAVKNTQEEWDNGKFIETSEVLHVKKQGLEFSFLNPPAAEHLSLVLEWKGETTQPLNVHVASNKDFTESVLTATPATAQLKDGWERASVQFALPTETVTRKWFVAVDGSQAHEVRLIQVNVLSDPSVFAKLHAWWRNTHK
ncbi:MAG: hypothetical protein AAB558_01795 [Patescibacteria group bacterium]